MEKIYHELTVTQSMELDSWVEASEAYYNSDDSIMSDTEFDELTERLISYNVDVLTTFIKSVIQSYSNGLEVVTDNHEMISLKKIKWESRASVSDINNFIGRKQLKQSPKLDGAAIKIKWDVENSKLLSVLTRGGLDITFLLQNNPTIFKTIDFKKPLITGELVINKKTYLEKYSNEYDNARAVVTSMVKNHKNTNWDLATNDVKFIPCTDGKNPLLTNLWKQLQPGEIYNLDEKIKYYKSDEFPYLCDGIVLAYVEEGPRQVKDNYPLNMVAIKFPGARAKAKVIGFEWSQKKSGKLTPKLKLEPTQLDGITVQYAGIYNYQTIIDKSIGIGSEVEIEKSNDIIPIVVGVISKSKNIQMPDCDYTQKGKFLYAVDMTESKRFKFYSALRSMQIDGIGETLSYQIGSVVDYNIIELFNTNNKPNICAVLNGGETWNKFKEFYAIKTLALDKLIFLLQFDNVGVVLAKKVAMLIAKKSTDTANIPNDVILNVCRGAGFQKIKEAMIILKGFGISVIAPLEVTNDTITFEMTGNPPGMTKNEFVAKLKAKFPNSLHETLKKDTKYLFCDKLDSNSGKLNKARKYNIKIVTYSDALHGKL